MNKTLKIGIIVLIVALVIGIAVFFIVRGINNSIESNNPSDVKKSESKEEFVKITEDGTKENTSSKVGEKKTLDGLEITNAKLTYKKALQMTELIANITNKTEKEMPSMEVRIHLIDKDGKELDYMDGPIGSLKPGETTQINIGITADFSNAYDYKIEKIK